ncbi:Protein of unknown function [Seinonella peptonophila]|uniref:DUF2848 domain-containing protein n=1 Tax=Seinonella peptonophila TaxID=112248 RepID=A0A1M4VJE5_9BACL|nr:DUF2848 family protein [Seinonella peptonophila]SHE69099.1 Protein of unknown function [Seinonella peptonophila]
MEWRVEQQVLEWKPRRFVIAGYTGRNQRAVKKHIEELKELGVPAPRTVPMLYDITPELLTQQQEISVVRNDGSGEAEVALLRINGDWYLGLASDHTDRILEAESIQKSKQVCAKPIAKDLWPLARIRAYWDELQLTSWVTVDQQEQLYQSGTLAEFLPPEQLWTIVNERGYASEEMVLLCGTLALIDGDFRYGEAFRAELYDPRRDETIKLQYQVRLLKDAEED